MKKTKAKGRTKRPAKERPATVRDYAKADFKPWEEYEGMWDSAGQQRDPFNCYGGSTLLEADVQTKRELMDAVCRGAGTSREKLCSI